MGILTLIVGLVLLLAGPWFHSQHTVGEIITIVGGIWAAVEVGAWVAAAWIFTRIK